MSHNEQSSFSIAYGAGFFSFMSALGDPQTYGLPSTPNIDPLSVGGFIQRAIEAMLNNSGQPLEQLAMEGIFQGNDHIPRVVFDRVISGVVRPFISALFVHIHSVVSRAQAASNFTVEHMDNVSGAFHAGRAHEPGLVVRW